MKLKIQPPLKRALDREYRHWENTVSYTIIILTQISSYLFIKGGKKKALHLTLFTYKTGTPGILKDAKSQKSEVNMRANEMAGLKYTSPACGFFQKRKAKLKEK